MPRGGPLPGWLAWLGGAAEAVYGAVVAWRNARYDRGIGVTRAALPVISVGNLSVGGTGKTPMVMWLAWRLRERGVRPAIALRGYKGGAGGAFSDEAMEYRRALPGVPVLVGGDRAGNIARLAASAEGRGVDCVLLDDGFQHRRLHRAVDIVLVDATRSPFEDRLLPAGWLREPVTSLRRAHAVVLTRFDASDASHRSLAASLARAIGRQPLTAVAHWSGLESAASDAREAELLPVSWLAGRRVVVACGIGNPTAFLRQVRQAVLEEPGIADDPGRVRALFYPDHHGYPARSIREIVDAASGLRADAIVTTEKDWTKLSREPAARWPCPVVRPRLDLRVEPAESLLGAILAAVGPTRSGEEVTGARAP